MTDGFDFTPDALAKHIIGSFDWREGETVLEPCKGGGAFFDNLPGYGVKDWCELSEGRDFLKYAAPKVDTIITNPPFRVETGKGRKNIFIDILEKALASATQRVIMLVGQKLFVSLTPARLQVYQDAGWFLARLEVYSVRQWFGRYYLLAFEKDKPPVMGHNVTNWS